MRNKHGFRCAKKHFTLALRRRILGEGIAHNAKQFTIRTRRFAGGLLAARVTNVVAQDLRI
jgi:hypothetical protein